MITINLTEDDIAFCQGFVAIQNNLLKSNNISLNYTTYREQRESNNLIGFVSEFAFHKFLVSQNIPFIASCFSLISNHQSNLLPPLADFITVNGLTIDIKSDRYDIQKLGAIVPNEKLNDIHLSDITIWLECHERNLQQVKIHGCSLKNDLLQLRDQPNATKPNGEPMPKPCKRMLSKNMRDINALVQCIRQISPDGLYQIAAVKV